MNKILIDIKKHVSRQILLDKNSKRYRVTAYGVEFFGNTKKEVANRVIQYAKQTGKI